VVVGPKGLAEGKVELKRRLDGSRELITPEEVIARLTS
jgi:prolyl-tRNA synthetase